MTMTVLHAFSVTPRGRRFRLLHLAVLCTITSACGKILGVDDYRIAPNIGGGHSTLSDGGRYSNRCSSVSYKSESCSQCVADSCCAEATACSQDPGCAAMIQCLENCAGPDDHTCRGMCNLTIWLSELDRLSALVQCEARRACDSCTSARVVEGGGECDACFAERCPEVNAAFSRDADAIQFSRCNCNSDFRVGSTHPLADCPCTQFSGGQHDWNEVQYCAGLNGDAGGGVCAAACNPNADWTCLGSVQWPAAPSYVQQETAFLELVAFSPVSGSPLQGFQVSACDLFDNCQSPKPTDQDGWVKLTLDKPLNPLVSETRFYDHFKAIPPDLSKYFAGVLYRIGPKTLEISGWTIVTRATIASLDQADHVTPDPSKGEIVTYGTPCQNAFVNNIGFGVDFAGVQLSIDSGDTVYYVGGDGTQTGAGLGLAAIPNVEPGPHTLTATLKKTNQLIGSFGVGVWADTLTVVELAPMPADQRTP